MHVLGESAVEARYKPFLCDLTKFSHLNGVINCAGIGAAKTILNRSKKTHSQRGKVLTYSARQTPYLSPPIVYNFVLNVNLTGTFIVSKLGAKYMSHHDDGGVIINAASVAAFDGQRGQVAYAASKGGVVSSE